MEITGNGMTTHVHLKQLSSQTLGKYNKSFFIFDFNFYIFMYAINHSFIIKKKILKNILF